MVAQNNNIVYVDANVLLEVLLERRRESLAEKALLQHARGNLAISTLTAHLVIHFGSEFHNLKVLRRFLSDYTVLDLTIADFDWAFRNIRNDDFEDALQLAVAVRNSCTRFITFDKKLHKDYKDLSNIQLELV